VSGFIRITLKVLYSANITNILVKTNFLGKKLDLIIVWRSDRLISGYKENGYERKYY